MEPLALADRYGRVATDLRVSLTDRCNLRCSYCMPAEGLDWLPGPDILTDDEVVRLVGLVGERDPDVAQHRRILKLPPVAVGAEQQPVDERARDREGHAQTPACG